MGRFFDTRAFSQQTTEGAAVSQLSQLPQVSTAARVEAFEERAAIMEFEGGLTRQEAERLAAEELGFVP